MGQKMKPEPDFGKSIEENREAAKWK